MSMPAGLKWPNSIADKREKDVFDYFNVMFPRRSLIQTVTQTSLNLERNGLSPTSHGELLKYMGIRLAMCIMPVRGGMKAYWNCRAPKESVYVPLDFYGRFGMARHRFEDLTEHLKFAPDISTAEQAGVLMMK
jgi:hypothetical protein